MEDEKFSRYERLKLFIKEIEDSKYSNRNVEWYDKHYNILEEYRMNFSDFTYIDNEISNKEFRQNASLVENLLILTQTLPLVLIAPYLIYYF